MNNRDLIKQYVDSGLKTPERQFNQLSGSELNTYLRKRLIAQEHTNNTDGSITFYEYGKFTPEQKLKLVSMTTEDNLRAILINFDYNDNDFIGLLIEHKDKDFLKENTYILLNYSSNNYSTIRLLIDKLGKDLDQNVVKEINNELKDGYSDSDRIDILKNILKQYDELDLYHAPLDMLLTCSHPEENDFIKYIVKSVEEKETYDKPRIDLYTLRTLFSYAQDREFETELAKYVLNYFYTFQDEQEYLEKIIKNNTSD